MWEIIGKTHYSVRRAAIGLTTLAAHREVQTPSPENALQGHSGVKLARKSACLFATQGMEVLGQCTCSSKTQQRSEQLSKEVYCQAWDWLC